jgi:hypothetical protein
MARFLDAVSLQPLPRRSLVTALRTSYGSSVAHRPALFTNSSIFRHLSTLSATLRRIQGFRRLYRVRIPLYGWTTLDSFLLARTDRCCDWRIYKSLFMRSPTEQYRHGGNTRTLRCASPIGSTSSVGTDRVWHYRYALAISVQMRSFPCQMVVWRTK